MASAHPKRAHPGSLKQRPGSGCILAEREFLLRTEDFDIVFNVRE
jgi:hypothetical protein